MEIICLVMMRQLAMRYMALLLQTVFLLCSTLLAPGQNGSERLVTSSSIPTMPPVIIIGFVGGFVNHDNLVHSAVELAAQLRGDYPSGVYAEVFENRLREKAHREILRLLDTNHDGTVSAEEKQNAHIIIYGMSWGGSETVALARELEKENIPVALTIQVDSISKIGQSAQLSLPTSPRPSISISRMDFSTARPKFVLPMRHTRELLEILDPTIKPIRSNAISIPGMIVSSRRLIPKSNVIRAFGKFASGCRTAYRVNDRAMAFGLVIPKSLM
jgi:hypothetical protein